MRADTPNGPPNSLGMTFESHAISLRAPSAVVPVLMVLATVSSSLLDDSVSADEDALLSALPNCEREEWRFRIPPAVPRKDPRSDCNSIAITDVTLPYDGWFTYNNFYENREQMRRKGSSYFVIFGR